MATQTTHYSLVKPAYEDQADVQAINGNMDIIDEAMHNNEVGLSQAEGNIAKLMVRQSAPGTFNTTADEYISSSTPRTFSVERVGMMLVVHVMFVLAGTNTTGNNFPTIGTLPTNFYPDIRYAQNIPVEGASGASSTVVLRIASSGELEMRRQSTAVGWVRAVFSVPLLPSLL